MIVMDNKELTMLMYGAYAKQAGGMTYDNRPLPTWEELGDERQACWYAAADAAEEYLSDFFE